ncbi:MAG: metallophosphoesterase family protein [Candidatus Thermoplasmatota archaeon]|nr:metallophosphoesterase family protein [Candidatus Thermoplasmatota archaeon]
MRAIVISDLHGKDVSEFVNNLIKKQDAELLIIAGDITQFGPAKWVAEFLNKIATQTIAIPGNCDPASVIEELAKTKAIPLHNKKIKFKNLTFVGFGGSNITPFNTILEFPESYIYEALAKIMERECILVTHCPAKGILDYMAGKGNLGSEAIAKIVKEYEPKLHISGHIHEARGIEMVGKTLHLNPGQAGKGCAALVRIDNKIEAELL